MLGGELELELELDLELVLELLDDVGILKLLREEEGELIELGSQKPFKHMFFKLFVPLGKSTGPVTFVKFLQSKNSILTGTIILLPALGYNC